MRAMIDLRLMWFHVLIWEMDNIVCINKNQNTDVISEWTQFINYPITNTDY